ncbi:hypothetical protein GCM10010404_52100 [Nonomuraea africana]
MPLSSPTRFPAARPVPAPRRAARTRSPPRGPYPLPAARPVPAPRRAALPPATFRPGSLHAPRRHRAQIPTNANPPPSSTRAHKPAGPRQLLLTTAHLPAPTA